MAISITRLSGGNTPADGSDPRTFPAIWNATATTLEANVGAGTGNVASDCIQPNFNTISENFTFTANYNGVSAGPITIASGFTVTVGATSAWSIV